MDHGQFEKSRAYLEMLPLRIPAGWRIGWNMLCAIDRAEPGQFGGSTIFHAVNEGRRFAIDASFAPEHDPEGSFRLSVIYQPWPRTEQGRRRKDVPFAFDGGQEDVHTFETRSYAELVQELETWMARCTVWTREGN